MEEREREKEKKNTV